jgi:hypothetical protein
VTKEEHALMIGVLALQMEIWNAMQKLLESREIISNDDVTAFLSIRTASERSEMTEKARAAYVELARRAGLDPADAGILESPQ